MKIFKIFYFFIFILLLLQLSSIKIYPGWFKHYGGINADFGFCIDQTSDGEYIVAGYSSSFTHGGYDFAIYKLNSSGNKVWFKHYGGTGNEIAYSIQQTSDGGYIVAGYSASHSYGGNDFAIYKLNMSGNKVWFKHYGGVNGDRAYSIQQTSDGGYIVAGNTSSYSYGNNDFAIYRLDSSGNKVWFKHYGGTENDEAFSIQQTSDGGYVVAGRTLSYTHGSYDLAIYKLDSNGNKTWFKHYGGSLTDGARSIQQTSDGGYIVAGETPSFTYGSYDFAIYKLNSNGNKVWFKHYGGGGDDGGRFILQTSDGGFIVAGHSNSYTYGSYDFALYKLNSSGNKVWFKHYGGIHNDQGSSVQQISGGGYIMTGFTYSWSYGDSDFAIYKLDSNGDN